MHKQFMSHTKCLLWRSKSRSKWYRFQVIFTTTCGTGPNAVQESTKTISISVFFTCLSGIKDLHHSFTTSWCCVPSEDQQNWGISRTWKDMIFSDMIWDVMWYLRHATCRTSCPRTTISKMGWTWQGIQQIQPATSWQSKGPDPPKATFTPKK